MLEIKDYAFPSPEQWRIVIKGMRNAYKSWDKSDSIIETDDYHYDEYYNEYEYINGNDVVYDDEEYSSPESFLSCNKYTEVSDCAPQVFYLGKKDKNLLLSLTKLGTSDRKVLRQLPVILDIKAPLYFWKQLDQYKVGTVTNSESTMHTITKKEFELSDFSFDSQESDIGLQTSMMWSATAGVFMDDTIANLNNLRETYLETGDKWLWQKIIEFLPESYNQTRTWYGSYETIINIILQRYKHKLNEWQVFCKWCIENIPLVKELIETINTEVLEYLYE